MGFEDSKVLVFLQEPIWWLPGRLRHRSVRPAVKHAVQLTGCPSPDSLTELRCLMLFPSSHSILPPLPVSRPTFSPCTFSSKQCLHIFCCRIAPCKGVAGPCCSSHCRTGGGADLCHDCCRLWVEFVMRIPQELPLKKGADGCVSWINQYCCILVLLWARFNKGLMRCKPVLFVYF